MLLDLSRLGPRSKLGALLRAPLALVPPHWRVPVLQGPLRGARWIVGSSTHGSWLGTYEAAKVRRFVAELRPDSVVFDLGAHAGYYTMIAARLAPRGRVYSFEPFPQNAANLREHLLLNRINNAQLYELAVGAVPGTARFRAGESTTSGQLATDGLLEVSVASLDELTARDGLPSPDLVKIDIEGGEHDALLGARDLLRRCRPTLFLATHGADVHGRCVKFLGEAGYELEPLDAPTVSSASELLCRPGRLTSA
jgi:FkbM family methyltransferase